MANTRWASARLWLALCSALAAPSSAWAGNAGDLDASFDGDGWAVRAAGVDSFDYATGVAVQADGKIVVCGAAHVPDVSETIALLRFAADGSRDATFGGDGVVLTPIGSDAHATAVAIQADGKIVVAGFGNSTAVLVRYHPDGSLDVSFDGDGIAPIPTAGGFLARDLAIQPDGRIVVVGDVYNGNDIDIAVVRRNADGSADLSFDGDGVAVAPGAGGEHGIGHAVALQSDGAIVVAGFEGLAVAVLRFLADGSLDPSFAGDGALTTPIGPRAEAHDVAIQSDGKIVVAGLTTGGVNGDFVVLRYHADGSLDAGFAGGVVLVNVRDGSFDAAAALALQTDGRIVVAGVTDFADPFNGLRVAVARLEPTGALDATFDGDGRVVSHIGLTNWVRGIALQADGRIVVGASSDAAGDSDIAVLRYLSDGAAICTAAPAGGCVAPAKAKLVIGASLDDRRDRLLWKAKGGAALAPPELADPSGVADYALCVYAGSGSALVLDAALPAGAAWRALGGTGYKFKGASPDGLSGAVVSGPTAKGQAKGRGGALPDPPLPLEFPVIVQLQAEGSPLCLQSTFTAAAEKTNTSRTFKAKLP